MKNTLIAAACLAFSSAALASGWTASEITDEMRGTASKYAELASQNYLKAHKKMILEVEFYRAGNQQFKFDIQGLDSAK